MCGGWFRRVDSGRSRFSITVGVVIVVAVVAANDGYRSARVDGLGLALSSRAVGSDRHGCSYYYSVFVCRLLSVTAAAAAAAVAVDY